MPIETGRNRRTLGSEPGQADFAALQELETRLTSTPPSLAELHTNSRALFRRDRQREEMFRLRPRQPEEF